MNKSLFLTKSAQNLKTLRLV